jgi:predicted AlkP superfamily pyrophosphatase or phosphodiesterase
VLFAVDGLEWEVLLPLLHRGELPTFRRLMEQGAYGRLGSMQPTLSPVIWTSLATGKTPREHGILGFTRRDETGGQTLYTHHDRTAAAFWNILSDADLRVDVVGWWMTFPVEPINGVMVAQTNTPGQADAVARRAGEVIIKGSVLPGVPGQVHPPEIEPRVMEIVGQVSDSLPERLVSIFGPTRQTMTPLERKLWNASVWSFRADAIYLELGRMLLERSTEFDLLAVYIGGTDIVGHRYWRYREPSRFVHPPSVEEIDRWGEIIDDYYRYLDHEIGELLKLLPKQAGVLIVSDHGMHAANLDGRFHPDDPPARVASGHHEDATPGVLVAWGDPFRAAERSIEARTADDLPDAGAIHDLLPTLLALKDLPVADDLPGSVLEDLLDPAIEIRHGPPVDFGEWIERRKKQALPADIERIRLEQLRSLGYIE